MTFLANLPHNLFVGAVFIAILMLLVAAHEMGHYLFARLFGMAAEEFAIGMGGKPWIYARRRYVVPVAEGEDPRARGESNGLEGGGSTVTPTVEEAPDGRTILHETTLFTVRPLPLGGFVRIKGMIPQEDGGEIHIPGGFFSKSPLKRWIVLAAGPAFWVMAGILLVALTFVYQGDVKMPMGTTLGGVQAKSGADRAGLKEGDRVVSVADVPVSTWYEMLVQVRDRGTAAIPVVVEREGRRIEARVAGAVVKAKPVLGPDLEPTGEKRAQTTLGVVPAPAIEKLPFGAALVRAAKLPGMAVARLASKFAHPADLADNLGGPGTMVKMTSLSVDEGLWPTVFLAGGISISLGIFNLLPFPPLDGGQMWIAFVEMLRGGRRLSMRTQLRVINVGFAMVLLLIGTVLVIDVRRWTTPNGFGLDKVERK